LAVAPLFVSQFLNILEGFSGVNPFCPYATASPYKGYKQEHKKGASELTPAPIQV
jgi:hypothetical protein